jgi:hypothetical protein
MYSYENEKMRHVESMPGMEGGGIKEDDGGGESNYDILQEIYKCHNVPRVQQ